MLSLSLSLGGWCIRGVRLLQGLPCFREIFRSFISPHRFELLGCFYFLFHIGKTFLKLLHVKPPQSTTISFILTRFALVCGLRLPSCLVFSFSFQGAISDGERPSISLHEYKGSTNL